MRRTVYAIPAFMLPVIVLGDLYSGIVTLIESVALSAMPSRLDGVPPRLTCHQCIISRGSHSEMAGT